MVRGPVRGGIEADPRLDNTDPEAAKVFLMLMRYHKLQAKIFYHLVDKRELFHAQMIYLKTIAANEGLSQCELAETIGVARSSATTALQRMEKAGLIIRRQNPEDQRAAKIFLSKKGRELDEETSEEMAKYINKCYKLDEADSEQFLKTLSIVNENVKNYIQSEKEGRKSEKNT